MEYLEVYTPVVMLEYAELGGRTLAHAHARSGESAKISGYLGKSDKFDEAIADFSVAYADQTESAESKSSPDNANAGGTAHCALRGS